MTATSGYERKSGGFASCLVPLLVGLALLCGVGYLAYRFVDFSKIKEKLFPSPHPDVRIYDPESELDKQKAPPPVVKPVETNETMVPVEPPPPPRKTAAELRSEAEAEQKKLNLEIDKVRQTRKSIPGLAGIRFGDVINGLPLATESLAGSDSTDDAGFCHVMFAPKLPTPFRDFDNPPLVRVTPRSRRVFMIEFSRTITRQPGWAYNPETTNLVGILSAKLKCKPYTLDCEEYPLADHTFVFPLGETTLTVGEFGGVKLKMILEHAGIRARAREESAALLKEALAEPMKGNALVSDKYPNGGLVKFGRLRSKNGTPRAFCGIVFGSLPPYCATIATPASSADSKGFFIDYRKTKCKPFMTFTHGKAEISRLNNAVIAVSLHSNGPDNGLSDADYFKQIRTAIERKFKTQPTKTEGEGDLPKLTYAIGSLEITLGPDTCGGFFLSAVNTVMKANW